MHKQMQHKQMHYAAIPQGEKNYISYFTSHFYKSVSKKWKPIFPSQNNIIDVSNKFIYLKWVEIWAFIRS